MGIEVALTVAVVLVAFALLLRQQYRRSLNACRNHHFDDYETTGYLRVYRVTGGDCYLDVEKKATCEHEGCEETDVEWDRHKKVAGYPGLISGDLEVVKDGLG